MAKKLAQQRGITRSLDQLGRVSVPIEMYRLLGISRGDEVEISTVPDVYGNPTILISKSTYNCFACNARLTPETTVPFKTILLCKECINELKGDITNG